MKKMTKKLFAFVLAAVMSIGVIGNMNIVAFGETDESIETAKNADSLIVSVDKNIVGYSDARVVGKDLTEVMSFTDYLALTDKTGVTEIKIMSADELVSFSTNNTDQGGYSGLTIYLANDIDVTDKGFASIGNKTSNAFKGIFDGQGYEVSGINITSTEGVGQGFFGHVSGATIKNLIVSGNIKSGYNQVGGIVGDVYAGTVSIDNCYNKIDIEFSSSTSQYAGGIVGMITNDSTNKTLNLSITNCTNGGNITAGGNVGGIVGGSNYTNSVSNCRNIGTITATGSYTDRGCGAIAGVIKNKTTTITECINNGTIKGSCVTTPDNKSYGYEASGSVVVSTMKDYSSGETVDTTYDVAVNYADTLIGDNAGSNRKENASITKDIVGYSDARVEYVNLSQVPEFDSTQTYSEGASFKIATATQLQTFSETVNDGKTFVGVTVYLANDIDMTDVAFTPIGYNKSGNTITFSGIFDGQGYEVSGIDINGTNYNNGTEVNAMGFFGSVKGAEIKNFVVSGSVTGSKNQYGGIVAFIVKEANTTIDNCYSKVNITSSGGSYIGGIAGMVQNGNGNTDSHTIKNCTTTGAVSGAKNVGGLVGGALYETSITNSRNIGTVTATAGTTADGCSGIVGVVKNKTVTVSDCINNGTVTNGSCTKTNDYVGYVNSVTESNAGAVVIICYYEDISDYRDETNGHTAPELGGCIFAGWYIEQDCTSKNAVGQSTTEGAAYAKFVDEDILTVKAQISSNLINGKANDDAEGQIRFVTTVDSLRYSKIGFKVSYDKGDGNGIQNKVSASNKVYTELFAVGTTANEDKMYVPEDFCVSSQYFKACTVRKVTEDLYGMQFTVTPFWTTQDGTNVDGETVVKMVDEAMVRNAVYVATTGTDEAGYGTSNRPYQSLAYAMDKVAKTGTIYIKDSCSMSTDSWTGHSKNIIITSADTGSVATIDFSGMQALHINDAVTFDAIKLVMPDTVYANGNALTITENAEITNAEGITTTLYGGSNQKNVAETNLAVYAGSYDTIYGGGYAKNVNGDTNITIGGKVNQDIDQYEHGGTRNLYAGSFNGTVTGNTNLKVVKVDDTRAKFDYIYGGGRGSSSVVSGTCNIEFDGIAESINGGSSDGVCNTTYVTMNDGYVEQIFGGSDGNHVGNETDKNASTNVTVLAGTVKRRIYGGCYNEADFGLTGATWTETWQVYGNTNVTLGPNVEFLFDYTEVKSLVTIDADNSLYAISRGGAAFDNECGTFIVNTGTSYLYGCQDDSTINYADSFSSITCHYFVTTNGNTATTDSPGTVTADGTELTISPAEGYKATVTDGNGNTTTYNEEGIFTLQELTNIESNITISIKFEKI